MYDRILNVPKRWLRMLSLLGSIMDHQHLVGKEKTYLEFLSQNLNKLSQENIQVELESSEYRAAHVQLLGKIIKFREAKVTPKKVGLFVTLWKRVQGMTVPYTQEDPVHFVLIVVREETQHGLFFFPKSTLIARGIMSTHKRGGKRGFRIYPPWTRTTNKQAQKTQAWQTSYFHDASVEDVKLIIDRMNSFLPYLESNIDTHLESFSPKLTLVEFFHIRT